MDIEGARKNVETEIPDWDFDGVRKDARKAWNETLSKIDITTNDKNDKTIFYTALYHTAISPNLFTDVDGRYLGMDLQVHQGDTLNPMYTIFSLWDTFRALHPLMTIIDPDLNNAFIRSLIKKHRGGGHFPNVGHGFQLYRYNDWLPCRSRHCRCIYERRS
ncbi:glycoside hydrolase family 92 protein [Bacteroides fragilis]|nr:glycoside hydrolase family 92 protein [Bacteroides fragilis]